MITDLLLEIVFNIFDFLGPDIADSLISVNDTLSTILDGDSFNTFVDFIECVFYVLPVDTLLSAISLVFTLWFVRIAVSFFKLVWNLIPFV